MATQIGLAQLVVITAMVSACSSSSFTTGGEADASPDSVGAEDTQTAVDTGGAADAEVDSGCTPPTYATCDRLTNCGCSAAQKCDSVAGATACVASGPGALDANCTTTSGCARDLTCIGGRCVKKCARFGTECAAVAGTHCGKVTDLQSRQGDVCAGACDPAPPAAIGSSCGTAAACRIYRPDGLNAEAYCETKTGTAGDREPCTSDASCKPGYFCDKAMDGTTLCWKWCRVGTTSSGCPTGQMCKSNSPKTVVVIRGASTEFGGCSP